MLNHLCRVITDKHEAATLSETLVCSVNGDKWLGYRYLKALDRKKVICFFDVTVRRREATLKGSQSASSGSILTVGC